MINTIESRIEHTINDREHGSRWLVKEALEILRDLALAADLSASERMQQLLSSARKIARARPAMAALSSAVSQVFNVETSVDNSSAVQEIAHNAQSLLDSYASANAHIADHARPFLQGHVLTCSISGTVVDVLLALREQIEHVTVLEGRPRYEGRETARLLSQQGLAVTLVTDAQADIFLPQCQSVVVGADSILVNGDVLNKAGTALIAWAAHGRAIPFYVLCETLKISPRRWVDHDPSRQHANLALLEEKEPSEVWEPVPPDSSGITVRNFYFDRTPYRLVTHIVTERGIVDRRAIREVAVQTRANERKLLQSTK